MFNSSKNSRAIFPIVLIISILTGCSSGTYSKVTQTPLSLKEKKQSIVTVKSFIESEVTLSDEIPTIHTSINSHNKDITQALIMKSNNNSPNLWESKSIYLNSNQQYSVQSTLDSETDPIVLSTFKPLSGWIHDIFFFFNPNWNYTDTSNLPPRVNTLIISSDTTTQVTLEINAIDENDSISFRLYNNGDCQTWKSNFEFPEIQDTFSAKFNLPLSVFESCTPEIHLTDQKENSYHIVLNNFQTSTGLTIDPIHASINQSPKINIHDENFMLDNKKLQGSFTISHIDPENDVIHNNLNSISCNYKDLKINLIVTQQESNSIVSINETFESEKENVTLQCVIQISDDIGAITSSQFNIQIFKTEVTASVEPLV